MRNLSNVPDAEESSNFDRNTGSASSGLLCFNSLFRQRLNMDSDLVETEIAKLEFIDGKLDVPTLKASSS